MSHILGFTAYSAYCLTFKGEHRDGHPRRHWDDLSEQTRLAWSNAADAVAKKFTESAPVRTVNEPGLTT